MAKRISETELILPGLLFMSLNEDGGITTTELIKKLRWYMNPSGEDLKILSGRSDDKFSQKVRNLKAHRTFERYGYAAYSDEKNGKVYITDKGRNYLKDNYEFLKYLYVNDFKYQDVKDSLIVLEKTTQSKKIIETFDENIIIEEGNKRIVETKIYDRSKKLRDYALHYYSSKNNKISCKACSFDFEDFYGSVLGKGFIEIHHIKPVFMNNGEKLEQVISDAVKNLVPVCSNCHRMIHRNWKKPIEFETLVKSIDAYGIFKRFA